MGMNDVLHGSRVKESIAEKIIYGFKVPVGR
jgi:hypothetical protein